MSVYVDTSALLSLLDRDDNDHEAVVEAMTGLVHSRTSLLTTSYALVETGALVRRRLGIEAFKVLGEAVSQSLEVVLLLVALGWRWPCGWRPLESRPLLYSSTTASSSSA